MWVPTEFKITDEEGVLDAINKKISLTVKKQAPADRIPTTFHLPLGVQLLRVYVQRRHSFDLPEESSSCSGSSKSHSNSYIAGADGATRKTAYKKIIASSGMKRDTSRIFTVPEEGESGETTAQSSLEESRKPMPRAPPPTTLPLNSLILGNTAAGNMRKPSEFKIDRPKYVNPPLTPSVCSTPLKDVNRVLHGTAVSICSANDELDDNRLREIPETDKVSEENLDDIPDVVKEALRCKRLNKLRNPTSRDKIEKKPHRDMIWSRKSSSLTDLEDTGDEATDFLPLGLRLAHRGISKANYSEDSPVDGKKLAGRKNLFNTITDPYYPVFRHDGSPVSQSLYDHYIASHYQQLVKEQSVSICPLNLNSDKVANGNPVSSSFNIKMTSSSRITSEKNPGNIEGFEVVNEPPTKISNPSLDVRLENKSRQENYRRSMSLPLKSLNAPADGDGNENDRRKSTSECAFDLPSQQQKKKKLEGLQLTPLMSKLSLLAGDERTSGFCSRDTTPSEFCDFSTLSSRVTRNKSESAGRGRSAADEDSASEDDVFWLSGDSTTKDTAAFALEKTELFICGHNNMVLFLLMEDGTGNNPDLIHNLVSFKTDS